MSLRIIHEDDVEALELPGRDLRWLVNSERLSAQHMSVCMIRVAPGEKVRPAHSHPNGEEAIHIITGSGRVMVGGRSRLSDSRIHRSVPARLSSHASQQRNRRDESDLFLRAGFES